MLRAVPLLAVVFGPIVAAVLLGLLQLGVYRGLAAAGVIRQEKIPIFPVFVFRGLFVVLAAVLAITVWRARVETVQTDPMVPSAIKEQASGTP